MVRPKRGKQVEDLHDSLLIEIFCRLPSYKLVFQCKCVSKRWCTLISDPYFIGYFISVQIDHHKKIPVKSTLISTTGEELTTSSSSTNPLTPLFDKLVSAHGLEQEPVVVGTCNDLVLCCASLEYQRDYYICNPCTTHWVALPPPPQVYQFIAVGFKCDLPYYSVKQDVLEGHTIQLNDAYRCRVVRIIIPDEKYFTKFKVQIFSFETGQWIESVVSTPAADLKCSEGLHCDRGFAYNGMLYWEGYDDDEATVLIGLDPFMINNNNCTHSDIITDDQYKCHFIQLDVGVERFEIQCMGEYGECLRMCCFEHIEESRTLYVWDLNEEDEVDWRKAMDGGDIKLPLQHKMRVYPLDERMFLRDDNDCDIDLLGFDPSKEDILYLCIGSDIVECNVRTKEWSIIAGKRYGGAEYFPIALPWWPTPIPTLPQDVVDP